MSNKTVDFSITESMRILSLGSLWRVQKNISFHFILATVLLRTSDVKIRIKTEKFPTPNLFTLLSIWGKKIVIKAHLKA